MKPKITLIGTLPPIKGISPYCQELLKSLSKRIGVKKCYKGITLWKNKNTKKLQEEILYRLKKIEFDMRRETKNSFNRDINP